MSVYPFGSDPQETPEDGVSRSLADDESLVELRCSVIVVRANDVLLIRRTVASGADRHQYWVLPGGRPRPGEGMLACARREVAEETGLVVQPERCAFIGDVVDPSRERRQVELVFTAKVAANHAEDLVGEIDAEPAWIGLAVIRQLTIRPPIGGFLPDVLNGRAPTIPYLGNLWRASGTAS